MPQRLPEPTISSDARTRAACEAAFLQPRGLSGAGVQQRGAWGSEPLVAFEQNGFDGGLPFLAAWAALRRHGGPHESLRPAAHSAQARRVACGDTSEARLPQLSWLSTDAAPPDAAAILRAAHAHPDTADLVPLARELAAAWPARVPGVHRRALDGGRVRLTLRWGERQGGDASARADADGGVGASNPPAALPPWFAQPLPRWVPRAIVVGAGMAGAAAARALAERGVHVLVLEASTIASGASGAPRAVLAPHIASWASPQARVVASAFLHARSVVERLGVPFEACGVLHPVDEDDAWGHEQALAEWGWPPDLLRVVSAAEAAHLAGAPIAGGRPAVWVAHACAVSPAAIARALLDHPRIAVHEHAPVDALHRDGSAWVLRLQDGCAPAPAPPASLRAELVVLATAGAWTPRTDERGRTVVDRTAPLASAALPDVPFDGTRGQLTFLRARTDHADPPPRAIVAANGFVLPPADGALCCGATHDRESDGLAATTRDDAVNMQALERLVPAAIAPGRAPERVGAWVGLRGTVNDHCPVVGAVPDAPAFRAAFARLCDGPFAAKWPAAPLLPGLFVTLAHGSRGTSTAIHSGELVADLALGGVRCIGDDMLPAYLPQRFLVRELRRGRDPAVP